MAAVVTDLVVEEVAGSLLGTVKQAFSYMWNSKENVENLRSEKNKLESMTKRVEQRINRATQNGDEILAGVEKWVEEALAHISTTEEFLQEEAHAKKTCLNLPMCVNPDTLRHYGKHATLKVTILETHQKNGAAFEGEISIPTASPGILELYPRENIEELGTHNSVLAKIIESVKGERTQITGIYGMGGVGKTTLATEVAARVKGVFALVVFVTVSQPVDAASVKTQVENAAKRIDKGEKVLIILDDIWAEVKLHTIGIPCGTRYPSCKVLLTSRQRSVCTAMDAHTIISVECLPMKEAWVLFKRVVGKRVETDAKLEKVARKVVEGCGGLPLILQAVGKALKDKENVKEWEKALYSIQKHETSNISPSIRSEFAHLKLSYNFLESEEAKSIFLLCSMFPEDFNVSLERLTYYGVGLQLFKDLNSLEDARNKVQGAVEILKSSCLLLDGENEFTTKMHDVVREVALLIASKDDNKFLVEAGKNLTEWEPRIGSLESYTGISLMTNDICKLPTGYELNIPLLKIFLIQGNRRLSEVSDEFIQAMKEAKVIDFQYNNITSLPKSLNQLTRLSMLNLSENKSLRDVSILGELNQLEILILNGSGITEIPHEIGKLVNLRLLHAERCPGLSRIAQGVLSKLHWLEELSIEYQPVEERNYNSLFEIEKLKRLKTFFIQIGVEEAIGSTSCIPGNRILILKSPYLRISHLMHVRKLIEVCDGIVDGIGFECIMNLDNIMPMVWCEGFGLKNIFIQSCSCLSYLVDSRVLDEMQTFHTMFLSEVEQLRLSYLLNLKVIWNCPDQYISLNKLVTLKINDCPNLERLFPVSVAQGLAHLQELKMSNCHRLEEVIWDGYKEASTGNIDTAIVRATNIVFPRLSEIHLSCMLNLTSFYRGNATIENPSLVKVVITECDQMEKWAYPKANGSTIDKTLVKEEIRRALSVVPEVRNENKKGLPLTTKKSILDIEWMISGVKGLDNPSQEHCAYKRPLTFS